MERRQVKYIYRITKRNALYLVFDLFIINLAYAGNPFRSPSKWETITKPW